MKTALITIAIGLATLAQAEAFSPAVQNRNQEKETEACNCLPATLRAITGSPLFNQASVPAITLCTVDELKEYTPVQFSDFPTTLRFENIDADNTAPKLNIPKSATTSLCMSAFIGLIGRRRRK